MKKPVKQALMIGVITLISAPIMLNLLLQVIDPLGAFTYQRWLDWSLSERLPHPTGFMHPAGEHPVADKTVTIDQDGNRIMPQVNSPTCTIAFIGDSLTFGMGVDDEETFAWLIAEAMPEVQFINTAKQGYDGSNLSRSVDHWDVDAYIYTIVNNDATAATEVIEHHPVAWLALNAYVMHFRRFSVEPHYNWTDYDRVLKSMQQENMLVFGLENNAVTAYASERLHVVMLPPTPRISVADQHPNVQGHEIIANTMLPYVENLADETCQDIVSADEG